MVINKSKAESEGVLRTAVASLTKLLGTYRSISGTKEFETKFKEEVKKAVEGAKNNGIDLILLGIVPENHDRMRGEELYNTISATLAVREFNSRFPGVIRGGEDPGDAQKVEDLQENFEDQISQLRNSGASDQEIKEAVDACNAALEEEHRRLLFKGVEGTRIDAAAIPGFQELAAEVKLFLDSFSRRLEGGEKEDALLADFTKKRDELVGKSRSMGLSPSIFGLAPPKDEGMRFRELLGFYKRQYVRVMEGWRKGLPPLSE